MQKIIAGLQFLFNLKAAIGFSGMVKWNAMRNLNIVFIAAHGAINA